MRKMRERNRFFDINVVQGKIGEPNCKRNERRDKRQDRIRDKPSL